MKRNSSIIRAHPRSSAFQFIVSLRTRVPVILIVLCLAFSHLPAHAAPAFQTGAGSQYTVGDCSNIDQNQLRDEIERHALAVITGDAAPLDIDGLVDRQWAALKMDAAVDAEVQRAVDKLSGQEDYLNRFISGWWSEKAQEYAERIANDAFGSPTLKVKLGELSESIGAEVARQIEGQFAQAASVALLCLKEYVGEQYSQKLFDAFQTSVQMETQHLELSVTDTPAIDAAGQHELALAGIGTIVVTQLVYRIGQKLSEKIAQRVAGKVVGRILGKAGSSFIPVAGWIIGVALIAYDLWEGSQGALPQIQESLQSEEVKAKIREEIAAAIKDDLPDQAALIALETSVSLVEQWQGFCDKYEYVCTVADQNADFRELLNLVTLDELGKLAQLVGWFMQGAGRAELDRAFADGSFEQLLALSDATVESLTTTSQPAVVRQWLALSGNQLQKAVEYGVTRAASPEEIDAVQLGAILALESAEDAQKLLSLTPDKRNVLLTLPGDTLQALVINNRAAELDGLAIAMLAPDSPPAQPARIAQEVAKGVLSVPDCCCANASCHPAAWRRRDEQHVGRGQHRYWSK